jgi:CheY-like chemotaxis protein
MKLLLIEDDRKTVTNFRKGIVEAGFTVDVAIRGDDGLHMARTVDYDLIVLDVMLPGREGWSVIRELRESGRQTPVLFLTAMDAVYDRVRGWGWGRTITSSSRSPSPNSWHECDRSFGGGRHARRKFSASRIWSSTRSGSPQVGRDAISN